MLCYPAPHLKGYDDATMSHQVGDKSLSCLYNT
jgi:hypothetical protein